MLTCMDRLFCGLSQRVQYRGQPDDSSLKRFFWVGLHISGTTANNIRLIAYPTRHDMEVARICTA
jgi:hypothetical protein